MSGKEDIFSNPYRASLAEHLFFHRKSVPTKGKMLPVFRLFVLSGVVHKNLYQHEGSQNSHLI